jgi:succinoglycan biosynthesis protein ExoM
MQDSAPRIVVCVPTYRRPVQLAALLTRLQSQRGAPAFRILVGNNESRALSSYPVLNEPSLPAFEVLDVTTRGVSAVRNAMVRWCLDREEGLEWIACIDDDQIPAEDWLSQLIATGGRHRADLVGGPVLKTVSETTFWSRGAADTSYLPKAEGLTETLNEAGNLLLSAAFVRGLGRPPFSLDFGRTGGEDYEFFLCARQRGARIVWAPDARVTEALPGDRLTFRGYVWRFYSIAAYQARADRLYGQARRVLRSIVLEPLLAPPRLVRSVIRDRDLAMAMGIVIRSVAVTAGRIVGLAGVRAERYATDERKQ